MLYIVSGFMRSGTSMMMQCLEAGGIEVVYSAPRNKRMNDKWGDASYTPNDNYYELEREEYQKGSLEDRFEGKCVKCLWGGLLKLPVGKYRIIFMRRPMQEIRSSLIAFFGDDNAIRQHTRDLDSLMDSVIEVVRDRKSVLTLDVVHYNEMVKNPKQTLRKLSWPIDVDRAAQIISENKRRFSK